MNHRNFLLSCVFSMAFGASSGLAEDIWAPWRSVATASQEERVGVEVDPDRCAFLQPWLNAEGALPPNVTFVSDKANAGEMQPIRIPNPGLLRALTIPLATAEGSAMGGHEIQLRFRCTDFPKSTMDESHGIMQMSFSSPEGKHVFWLHAYSKRGGLMINGFAANQQKWWPDVRVMRGAMEPPSAVWFDSRWHEIRMINEGPRTAIFWDGFLIFQADGNTHPITSFHIQWVKPGPFEAVELAPVKVCPARFTRFD